MTETVERMLPLYEAKMIHQFDHRWATYEPDGTVRDATLAEKRDPAFVPLPRYWVRGEVVDDRLGPEGVLVGVRDITNSTNERTVISALFPRSAVGNNLPIILDIEPALRLRLLAYLSSFALDYVARPKVGGVHLNFFIANQLAVLPPERLSGETAWCADLGTWLDSRVLWLIACADDLAGALGIATSVYDPDVRPHVWAELDAAMFHLVGVPRDDVDYIMETFPIVKRKDIAAFGSFRTKELILEAFDAMQQAIDSGGAYDSPLDHLVAREGADRR